MLYGVSESSCLFLFLGGWLNRISRIMFSLFSVSSGENKHTYRHWYNTVYYCNLSRGVSTLFTVHVVTVFALVLYTRTLGHIISKTVTLTFQMSKSSTQIDKAIAQLSTANICVFDFHSYFLGFA